MQFQGFKPQAMERIAGTLGYKGDMSKFKDYLQTDPVAKMKFNDFQNKAIQMMNGGMVRKNYAPGGLVELGLSTGVLSEVEEDRNNPVDEGATGTNNPAPDPDSGGEEEVVPATPQSIGQTTVDRMQGPALPVGGKMTAAGTVYDGTTQDVGSSAGQLGVTDPAAVAGQASVTDATFVDPRAPKYTMMEEPAQYVMPNPDPNYEPPEDRVNRQGMGKSYGVESSKTGDDIEGELDKTDTITGIVSDEAQVKAETQDESAVSGLNAAQGESVLLNNPVQRKIEEGELVEAAANAKKASKFTEQIQAAEATPTAKATVQGQLEGLMQDFEGGATPPWAAGAMRAVSAKMAARGLSASSMAGQALVQAAMESALPIASADAATFSTFEQQNLSNRQNRQMLAAEQRAKFIGQEFDQKFQAKVANAAKVSDIANMNFTAEQQIALENSRAANTMQLANLSNRQGLVMAEAAALADLDMANLNNRQAAAVQNAQSFLAMDMTNVNNEQQVAMFKAQQRTQSLFTDTAASNAAKQFNATSENQSEQFFSNLKTQTSQFNAAQANAIAQSNAGEASAVSKFNAEIENQRDQFNAQNSLVVAQSNAVWRREIATASTAAVNRANEINAKSVLDMSNQAYSNLWQEHADMMEWAWTSSDNERDRQNAVTLSNLAAGKARSTAQYQADAASSSAVGDFVGKLLLQYTGSLFG